MEQIKTTKDKIEDVCNALSEFLCEKNRRYGNSAIEPARVFSNSNSSEQILVRLDDKISRIQNSEEIRKNDLVDFMGYLVLYCVSQDWLDFRELID